MVTTSPCGSTTVPEIEPLSTCPSDGINNNSAEKSAKRRESLRSFILCISIVWIFSNAARRERKQCSCQHIPTLACLTYMQVGFPTDFPLKSMAYACLEGSLIPTSVSEYE